MTEHRLRDVIVAGHSGDVATARAFVADDDPDVRAAALGALLRCDALTDDELRRAAADPSPIVRRRVAEFAATRPGVDLAGLLDDADSTVVEVAAWAAGEQGELAGARPERVARLADLAITAEVALVREAAAAALGAIGDPAGLPAILHACADKPHIRRRAVLALAPFMGTPAADAAIEQALTDRDWQVRQSAEDLSR